MLRTLVALLVAANLLLLAYGQGWLDGVIGIRPDGDREPERLQRQVHPGWVRVVPPPAASAVLAAAAASAAAGAASAASGAPVMLACLEAGPFAPAELAAAEKALRDAGLASGAWTSLRTERKGAFMIYMGRYPDDEALQKKLDELRRLKLSVEALRNSPELQPGLSLGRFDDKAAADSELGRLSQRGVNTARVITLTPPVAMTTLRLQAADAAQRELLLPLKLAPQGKSFQPCAVVESIATTSTVSAPASSAAAGKR
ncbi:MAG: SPOR domain-containing protein [Burkholderiales bacterium]|nr:SPOR domain-containing protein [Burkholderiales bacterium]